jgi:ABC-type transport system involved in multi-copper enzyme maturation permease subunit
VGPLFYYELVRLARKGRSTVLRCAYALVVFGALGVVYQNCFPDYSPLVAPFATPTGSGSDVTRLAEDFVLAVLWAQSIATFVLGPVYVAGTVVEERERGTLDLLFTSHLTDREIVLGKLASRSVHLGAILLTGLPLLAITQLWGGVDVRLLLAAFLATALNVLAVAAVSVRGSAQARTLSEALANSYGSAGPFFLLGGMCFALTPVPLYIAMSEAAGGPARSTWLSPLLSAGPGMLRPLLWCVVGNCLFIAYYTASAVLHLRPRPRSPKNKGTAAKQSTPPLNAPAKTRQPLPDEEEEEEEDGDGDAERPFPPVGDRPLLWKETYLGSSGLTWWVESVILADWRSSLFLVLAVVPLALVVRWQIPVRERVFPDYLLLDGGRFLLVLPAATWCGALVIRAANGICGERQAGTLDTLLTVPVSPRQLLGSKWLGAILYARCHGYVLAALVGLETVAGFVHPVGAALLALAAAVHVAFFAGLGVWLSLVCRTTLAARVSAAAVLLVLLLIAFQCARTTLPASWYPRQVPLWIQVADVANPMGVWWYFASFPDDPFGGGVPTRFRLEYATAGVLAFAALAGLLWLDAWRRFRRYRVD